MNAKRSCLIGSRTDNATIADAADDDGLAAQIGAVTLFHGRIKSVHVDVQNRASG